MTRDGFLSRISSSATQRSEARRERWMGRVMEEKRSECDPGSQSRQTRAHVESSCGESARKDNV